MTTSSTGPVPFGCIAGFTMQEAVFRKRCAALLHDISRLLDTDDDYECRRGNKGGVKTMEIKLHLPFRPRDSKLVWMVRQLFVRVNLHLLEQTVVIVKTGDRISNRYTLLAAPEKQEEGPPPIAQRRMAVVSRKEKGKPSVTWYQVPIYESDKVDTDTYARAIALARADGMEGDLQVFSENDADLLRDVVTKLEMAAKRTRAERTGKSTSGRLVFLDYHHKK